MFRILILFSALSCATAIFLTGCENDVQSISKSVAYSNAVSKVEAIEGDLIALRHDLHRNPEVSGKEVRTSAKVAEKLTGLGFDVQENVGGYGVVGILQTGRPGAVVAYRADMDATAQKANDNVSYASQVEGVHHICGHDMHTTIGIALAEGISHVKDDLSGTVMLIFQPKEEVGTGADDMIADGIFAKWKQNALFGLHTAPFEVGEIYSKPNEMMAGRAEFTANISGTGDIVMAADEARNKLRAMAAVHYSETLKFGPQDFISVDIAPSIVSASGDSLTLTGYVMSAQTAKRPALKARVLTALDVNSDNVQVDISYRQALEGVKNDPELEARAQVLA